MQLYNINIVMCTMLENNIDFYWFLSWNLPALQGFNYNFK